MFFATLRQVLISFCVKMGKPQVSFFHHGNNWLKSCKNTINCRNIKHDLYCSEFCDPKGGVNKSGKYGVLQNVSTIIETSQQHYGIMVIVIDYRVRSIVIRILPQVRRTILPSRSLSPCLYSIPHCHDYNQQSGEDDL